MPGDDQMARPLAGSWGTDPIVRCYGEVRRERFGALREAERNPMEA